MIKLLSQNGNISYDICEYVIDTYDELNAIPKHVGIGSLVFVIEKNKTYILSNHNGWVEKPVIENTLTEDVINTIINTQLQPLTNEEIDTLFGGNKE